MFIPCASLKASAMCEGFFNVLDMDLSPLLTLSLVISPNVCTCFVFNHRFCAYPAVYFFGAKSCWICVGFFLVSETHSFCQSLETLWEIQHFL